METPTVTNLSFSFFRSSRAFLSEASVIVSCSSSCFFASFIAAVASAKNRRETLCDEEDSLVNYVDCAKYCTS